MCLQHSVTLLTPHHLRLAQITIKGAKQLFLHIKHDNRYPMLHLKHKYPLWLRLEYNYIACSEAASFLKEEGISYCFAENRDKCGPKACANNQTTCKLHLYVFGMQYTSAKESQMLREAKSKVILAKEKKQQNVTSSFPTYLFLDTCAIINMISEEKGALFTFEQLIARAKQGLFGHAFESAGDRVYLIGKFLSRCT